MDGIRVAGFGIADRGFNLEGVWLVSVCFAGTLGCEIELWGGESLVSVFEFVFVSIFSTFANCPSNDSRFVFGEDLPGDSLPGNDEKEEPLFFCAVGEGGGSVSVGSDGFGTA